MFVIARERILGGVHWARIFAVGQWQGLYESFCALPGGSMGRTICARVLDATRFAYNALLQDFVHLTYETSSLWVETQTWRVYAAEMEKKVSAATARANDAEHQRELERGLNTPHLRPGDSLLAQGLLCEVVPAYALEAHKKIIQSNVELGKDNAALEKTLAELSSQITALQEQRKELHQRADDRGKAAREHIAALEEQNKKLHVDLGEARAKGVPMYIQPKVTMGVEWLYNGRVEVRALDQFGGVLARIEAPRQAPVVYGVDFSKGGDDTVVTVQQGNKVLHVINIAKEREKHVFTTKAREAMLFFAEKTSKSRLWGCTRSTMQWPGPRFNSFVSDGAAPAAPSLPARHGKPWSLAEDRQLQGRYLCGMSLGQLAQAHQREWEAIVYRLGRICGWPRRVLTKPVFLERARSCFFYLGRHPMAKRAAREHALVAGWPGSLN